MTVTETARETIRRAQAKGLALHRRCGRDPLRRGGPRAGREHDVRRRRDRVRVLDGRGEGRACVCSPVGLALLTGRGTGDGGVVVIRLFAIAAVLMFFVGPVGDVVVGAMEVGYQARESNTRLAVSVVQSGNAEIVSASEWQTQREER